MVDDLELLDAGNWPVNLESVLRNARPGDTIVVPNKSVLALAERMFLELGMTTDEAAAVTVVVRST